MKSLVGIGEMQDVIVVYLLLNERRGLIAILGEDFLGVVGIR